MRKKILTFIEKLEGMKTACQNIHWVADNMSQHELYDKIRETIAEFEDKVAEVEQGLHGKLPMNKLHPKPYKATSHESLILDAISLTTKFYKSLSGDAYIGMRSDCESFISDMQRYRYLITFTLKEELRRRLRAKLNEAVYEVTDKNGYVYTLRESEIVDEIKRQLV